MAAKRCRFFSSSFACRPCLQCFVWLFCFRIFHLSLIAVSKLLIRLIRSFCSSSFRNSASRSLLHKSSFCFSGSKEKFISRIIKKGVQSSITSPKIDGFKWFLVDQIWSSKSKGRKKPFFCTFSRLFFRVAFHVFSFFSCLPCFDVRKRFGDKDRGNRANHTHMYLLIGLSPVHHPPLTRNAFVPGWTNHYTSSLVSCLLECTTVGMDILLTWTGI